MARKEKAKVGGKKKAISSEPALSKHLNRRRLAMALVKTHRELGENPLQPWQIQTATGNLPAPAPPVPPLVEDVLAFMSIRYLLG